ncbi:hypothetical protein BD414DRAFT_499260 [Trametes punicea]|nr:hypothetical protein BD414DRAFT_499260 [Trametes punicea]
MGNSLEDWKRVPTTADVLFGIHLPYRPPKNPVGAFFWRKRVWLETTSGLCLFEPWEKILIRESLVPSRLLVLSSSRFPPTPPCDQLHSGARPRPCPLRPP